MKVRDDGGGVVPEWCVYVTHKRQREAKSARGTEIACGGDVGLKRN